MTADLSDAERGMLIDGLTRSRRGFGLHAPFSGEARETNPRCGDDLTVRVSVGDGMLTALSWHGRGCAVSMAAAAALAEIAPGRPVDDLRALAERYFASVERDGSASVDLGPAEAFVGVGRYPLRATCATLAWRAALAALPPPVPDPSPPPGP
ncbi:iron-sulfur cluster assembly scaffold protein [Planctomonas psychrotolerans]|uniref:iron-sulfur cluster assembly scaffold protein n=1 Tax=Planctomonas psychrotolerans TaxID=2528712 RepID=UPI00123A3BD6|nr:iron-sulfur cluster assembly scaffold protein [Planctomonas psychrotolerans]